MNKGKGCKQLKIFTLGFSKGNALDTLRNASKVMEYKGKKERKRMREKEREREKEECKEKGRERERDPKYTPLTG